MNTIKTQKKTRKNGAGQVPSSSVVLPMLPPCRICGEKASGFHYGVNTCEACKAFFRRNLEKGSSYKCIENGNCEILPGKRNCCASCRFNKCLSLGMCKEAIKTGRYTHEKKAEDIKEVKRLESNNIVEQLSPQTTKPSPKPISSPTVTPSDEELEKIIDSVIKAFNSTTPYTQEFFEALPHLEQKYLEQKMLQQQVFGPLNPLPKDEYARILQVTGIDADGRKEMFQSEIPHIEVAIKRFVTFVKSIPGFTQLCMDDQIAIIKNGKFEAWMILGHRAFNPHHKLYVTQGGFVQGMDEIVKLSDIEFVDSMFAVQTRIHNLCLTQEELCIVGSLAVMLTDDCVVKDIAIIEESQELLLQCLFYLLEKNGRDKMMKFSQIVSCLVQLRTAKKLHQASHEELVKDWAGKIDFPPLLFEIWSA